MERFTVYFEEEGVSYPDSASPREDDFALRMEMNASYLMQWQNGVRSQCIDMKNENAFCWFVILCMIFFKLTYISYILNTRFLKLDTYFKIFCIFNEKVILGQDNNFLLQNNQNSFWLVGCRNKSNCHTKDLGLWAECPPWQVFLRDNNPYLCEFRKNHGKILTAMSTSATENLTHHLPSTSFERRTAWLLVGPIKIRLEFEKAADRGFFHQIYFC